MSSEPPLPPVPVPEDWLPNIPPLEDFPELPIPDAVVSETCRLAERERELLECLRREQDMHDVDRNALHELYEREAQRARRLAAENAVLVTALKSHLEAYTFDEVTQTVSINGEALGTSLRSLRELMRALEQRVC